MFASTSALCFDGDFISPDRFIDIATSTHTTNKPYSLVHLRNKWVRGGTVLEKYHNQVWSFLFSTTTGHLSLG
jgi:erythromycin esterase-like protein